MKMGMCWGYRVYVGQSVSQSLKSKSGRVLAAKAISKTCVNLNS